MPMAVSLVRLDIALVRIPLSLFLPLELQMQTLDTLMEL